MKQNQQNNKKGSWFVLFFYPPVSYTITIMTQGRAQTLPQANDLHDKQLSGYCSFLVQLPFAFLKDGPKMTK